MAYIHARRDKDGKIKNYRPVVSDGLNWKGQQRRRCSTWTPPNPRQNWTYEADRYSSPSSKRSAKRSA